MRKRDQNIGELLTNGEELFIGISLMTALTLIVLMAVLIYNKALPSKYATVAVTLVMAFLVAPAFVMGWFVGWAVSLLAVLVMGLVVAERRKAVQKQAAKQV